MWGKAQSECVKVMKYQGIEAGAKILGLLRHDIRVDTQISSIVVRLKIQLFSCYDRNISIPEISTCLDEVKSSSTMATEIMSGYVRIEFQPPSPV